MTILDISKYNKLNSKDYDHIAKNYKGVIMRIGYTGWGKPAKRKVVDELYEQHDRELRKRGVLLGVYWYGTDESTGEAREAARVLIGLAKGRDYPLGVFYDTEDNYYQTHMGKRKLTDVVLAFADHIRSNTKYRAGVYASSSWYKNKLYIAELVLAGLVIWEANYGGKNDGSKHGTTWYNSDLHQYTSNHWINGKRFDDNVIRRKWWKDPNVKIPKPELKTINEVAKEVISGKYGNGQVRKDKLTKEGYNYSEVQKEVNRILNQTKLKPINEIAKEVISGKYGNGQARKDKLTKEGYNYSEVQKEVNRILKR